MCLKRSLCYCDFFCASDIFCKVAHISLNQGAEVVKVQVFYLSILEQLFRAIETVEER